MIELLRIKCPSCGIILEIKNSKHEAVKRITCPNCKKLLAVNFLEETKPAEKPNLLGSLFYGNEKINLKEGINRLTIPDSEHIEINVVRTSDGNCKCIVRGLSTDHSVQINGVPLVYGDKVVLAHGDKVETGKNILRYGCPVSEPENESATKSTEGEVAREPSKPFVSKTPHEYWPVTILILVATFLLTILFWPTNIDQEGNKASVEQDSTFTVKDEKDSEPVSEMPQEKTKQTPSSHPQKMDIKLTSLNDYELEKLAMDGDAKAQYELGKRWVNKHDSINIVKGINYLKLASQNGSSEARKALNSVSSALEREASHGNTTAENILREQM